METFDIEQVAADRAASGRLYREFLRRPSLSAGLYELAAGAEDPQKPHTEDEVYYVLRGRARFRSAGRDRPVAAGSVIFVPAREEHRFHTITEDLSLLVLFAPAEGTREIKRS
jgi:mannose-6-phosphate isomerase-like protein (cupin superfamily)